MNELWKLIGHRADGRPIYEIRGGAISTGPGSDGEPDEPDDAEGADDAETEEESEAEYVPPTKEELDEIKAKNKTASDEAKGYRLKLREAEAKLATQGGSDAPKDAEGKSYDDGVKAGAEPFRRMLAESQAKTMLLSAGYQLKKGETSIPEKVMRMIDHANIDVHDDGKIEGLEAEVDAIKDAFPERFIAPKRKRLGSVSAGEKDGGAAKTLTASEQQAAKVLRGKSA